VFLATHILALFAAIGGAPAQTPAGAIAGVVADSAGAPVAGALVTVTDRDTGLTRGLVTSSDGVYVAAALPPGAYGVAASTQGFEPLERFAVVEAGTTTALDLTLQPAGMREEVTVDATAPLIRYDHHQVGGGVSRKQIENLPLNGRNYLELAKLEPGVPPPTTGNQNRVFVHMLGAGGSLATPSRVGNTRVTVDGANVVAIGAIGAQLQVSQEAVREFNLTSVNFNLSTGLTSSGAVNVVTRSGGNELHGGAFYFYRDHNLAASPSLGRDPDNPDPFFQRAQFGFAVGGPVARDRAFFFTGYERTDQRGVVTVEPSTPEFAPLGGTFPSPFLGDQFNLRLDARLNEDHNAFVRYTHDANQLFAPVFGGQGTLPSGWSRVDNWVDQSIVGLTSVLSSNVVNDLRFSYFFVSTGEAPATEDDCPGCLGVGAPRIIVDGADVELGRARTASNVGRRYQLTDSLAWQRGNHGLRLGFDWEHSSNSIQQLVNEPATVYLYAPQDVRDHNERVPPDERIPLPSSFLTLDDILRLPLRRFMTGVGPGLTPQRDFRKNRQLDAYRLYIADTWRAHPRLTLNYGLAWSYEPNTLNTDLPKPALLSAILGAGGLGAPVADKDNFSPAAGFAWAATRDGRTVIRGGAGWYYDPATTNATVNRERQALLPAGTGRANVPSSAVFVDGRRLHFTNRPTAFTGADLLAVLGAIRGDLASDLDPDNRDFTFRNMNLNKTGRNLTDPAYETPYALHVNVGVQRELAADLVVSADFVWRRFLHVYLSEIDYNRYDRRIDGVQTPVIRICTSLERDDPAARCSDGPITFDNTTGIAQYEGLLVRVERRFSRRTQFLVSYALGSFDGSNGVETGTGFDYDDWFANYGPLPTDRRHILNASGIVELPWRLRLSANVSAQSRPPFSAYVGDVDFDGDGTSDDLLPGTTVNEFNRGSNRYDLVRLVDAYNRDVAGRRTASGQIAPTIELPADFALGDSFFTADLRVSHTVPLGGERARLVLFGEVFNLFNVANLVDYGGDLDTPVAFGRPGARFTQVFGSGGPRAFQFGARFGF
jgi:hypothetical protein